MANILGKESLIVPEGIIYLDDNSLSATADEQIAFNAKRAVEGWAMGMKLAIVASGLTFTGIAAAKALTTL